MYGVHPCLLIRHATVGGSLYFCGQSLVGHCSYTVNLSGPGVRTGNGNWFNLYGHVLAANSDINVARNISDLIMFNRKLGI